MVSLFFTFILYFFASKWNLNSYGSKQGLWAVSRCFWGSAEPPKVVILLGTSFKNRLFKQCASKTSSKVLLSGFQTAQVSKMKPEGAPKASHEPWFESSCTFWTPRGATAEQIILWFVKIVISFSTDFYDFWNAPLLSWIQIQLPADVQVTFNG